MKFQGHKVLVIGDTHDSPHIPQDRFKWIAKHIKKIKPDYIIHIGDFEVSIVFLSFKLMIHNKAS